MSAGWAEDGEVLLARTVTAEGRSTARVGGQLAPVSALAELAGELVEVHGQHDGQRLLSTVAQTRFLDRYAGAESTSTPSRPSASSTDASATRGPPSPSSTSASATASARWTCSPTRFARSRSRRRGRARPRS